MEQTKITYKTHPELYEKGIIITNAPYRKFFYHVEKLCNPKYSRYQDRRFTINILSKDGIQIEEVK